MNVAPSSESTFSAADWGLQGAYFRKPPEFRTLNEDVPNLHQDAISGTGTRDLAACRKRLVYLPQGGCETHNRKA